MYSVFLSSYTNTRESLGELEKAVETHTKSFGNTRLRLVFPQHFSFSKLLLVFVFNNYSPKAQ